MSPGLVDSSIPLAKIVAADGVRDAKIIRAHTHIEALAVRQRGTLCLQREPA
jgi:hypothetical protein